MDNSKNYLSIKEVAEFLGLKYHNTRNLLLADKQLKCYVYGRTKLWKLSDIIDFQHRHLSIA